MDREARRAAKTQLVAQMEAGQSWQVAATSVGTQTSRATAYRLLHRVRIEGAMALVDQRHGHQRKCASRCGSGWLRSVAPPRRPPDALFSRSRQGV